MDLTSDDAFAESLAALKPAQNFHTPDLSDDLSQLGHDIVSPGFGRTGANFRAAATSAMENDLSFGVSDDYVLQKQYQPIVDALNKDKSPFDADAVKNPYLGSSFNPFTAADRMARGQPITREGQEEMIWQRLDALRQSNPGVAGNLPHNKDELIANMRAEQRASLDYARGLGTSSGPITGTVAQFAGGAVGGFSDPVNIGATFLGVPAAESLLKTALVEGGVNTAATLAGLPSRAAHYSDIGEPLSAGDMAGEVAGSAVLGAGFGVGAKLFGRMLGLKGHDLVAEFEAQNPDPAPTLRTAAALVEDDANRAATNPFSDTAEGRDLHRQAIMATQGALDERRPDLLPDYSDHVEAAARAADPEAVKVYNAAVAEHGALWDQLQQIHGQFADGSPELAAAWARVSEAQDRIQTAATEISEAAKSVRASSPLGEGADFAGGFTTARGSSYVRHSDGTTTRNKAARNDVGHEGQSGPQPRSEMTFYVTNEHADQLGLFQTQGGPRKAIVQRPDGTVGIKYLDGPHAGKFERRTVEVAQSAPAIGLTPVETWRDGTRVHFGNPITEVREPSRALPAAIEAPADRANHPRRHDPEALKPFTDPVRKPAAFHAQADDLARELAPPPEPAAVTQPKAGAGADEKPGSGGGGTEAPASESPSASEAVSPYGDAANQIAALDRLPEADLFAEPVSGRTMTVKAAAADLKRQARAVERLRGCIGGE